MKIGILVEDAGYSDMNFSTPEKGNTGVSGTVFEFIMLIKYLLIYDKDDDIYVYHFGNNKYPKGCKDIILDDSHDLFDRVDDGINLLIIQNGLSQSFMDILGKQKYGFIYWAHNYVNGETIERLIRMENLKRVVFVGREQYDHYVSHDIIDKSVFIYNMFNSNCDEYYRHKELNHVVTYTGSLIEAKGFHMLAKVWKDVLKEIPDAKLNVLGSGKLYDQNNKLGKYGIAEEKYENLFMRYLLDNDNKIHSSVNFRGVLGQEKINIYRETMVGIMNPTGISETFGLSAVEMEACGIPVITRKKFGLLDTVIDKQTGILINTEKQLRDAIIMLLKDENKNRLYGKQAKLFVKKFNPEIIISQWVEIIREIESGINAKYVPPKSNYFNDMKWVMIVNRFIRRYIKGFPSVIGIKARTRLKQ